MSLFSLYKLLLRENLLDVLHYAHFRIWIAVLILWSSTFFFWAFLNYLRENHSTFYSHVAIGQVIINIAVYAFVGYTFWGLKNAPCKKANNIIEYGQ